MCRPNCIEIRINFVWLTGYINIWIDTTYSKHDPFIPGSMLHAMFSGRFDTKPSEDGSYFIDRDGTHFRYILNYLRTGELIVPQDKIIRRELLAEARFYQFEGIIHELTAGSFNDSSILSSDQCQTLMNWLRDTQALTKSKNLFPLCLYRATRDGWDASDFHSCCDNKGPTVTVVKRGNHLFGGYAGQSWEGRSYLCLAFNINRPFYSFVFRYQAFEWK